MANVFALLGLLLICLAALMNILSLSLPFWEMKEHSTTVSGDMGYFSGFRLEVQTRRSLWEICSDLGDKDEFVCWKPRTDTSAGVKLVLVRAALFIATFILAGSVICIILKLCVLKGETQLNIVAWILSLAGGLMSLCAFAIYSSLKWSESNYMIAFYLAIAAWIVAWVAGGFVFAASRKTDDLVVM